MAKTFVKPKHDMAKGESVTDPTRASKPAAQTYRYPLAKGLPSLPDKDAPLTGYARNQYGGPSSVSVTDSADMTDFPNLAQHPDPVLKSLQVNGHGDQSGENSAVADLERKIDTTGYPTHPAMKSRTVDDGSPGGKV